MKGDFHEKPVSHESIEGPSNRSFGLTVGGILVGIGVVRWVLTSGLDTLSTILFVVGGLLVSLGAFRPSVLTIPNWAWMRLGALLATIVNPIIMFLIFAIAFVPSGLIMRLRGHDPLRLQIRHDVESYWISRAPSEPAGQSMTNQY